MKTQQLRQGRSAPVDLVLHFHLERNKLPAISSGKDYDASAPRRLSLQIGPGSLQLFSEEFSFVGGNYLSDRL